jgi:hypothetical protein
MKEVISPRIRLGKSVSNIVEDAINYSVWTHVWDIMTEDTTHYPREIVYISLEDVEIIYDLIILTIDNTITND